MLTLTVQPDEQVQRALQTFTAQRSCLEIAEAWKKEVEPYPQPAPSVFRYAQGKPHWYRGVGRVWHSSPKYRRNKPGIMYDFPYVSWATRLGSARMGTRWLVLPVAEGAGWENSAPYSVYVHQWQNIHIRRTGWTSLTTGLERILQRRMPGATLAGHMAEHVNQAQGGTNARVG